MKHLKYIFLLFFIAIAFVANCQTGYHIKYKVKGLKNGTAYLTVCRGNERIPLDTCTIAYETIEFAKNKEIPIGVYRIIFKDSLYTEFVYAHEEVIMENQLPYLRANLKIIKGNQTKIYYEYWDTAREIKDTIDELISIGNVMYLKNGGVFNYDLDSMQKRVVNLYGNLNIFTDSLIDKAKGMFITEILKAYLVPDYNKYLQQPNAFHYKTRLAFLRDHYFDYVNFADTNLLNTEVFFKLTTDYINTFADPQTTENYIRVIGYVLGKANASKPIYNYILNLLLNTFETSDFEEVYIYLIENYYIENSCQSDATHSSLKEKAEAFKKLRIGNVAPDVIMKDISGNDIDLYSLNSSYTLIMFWSDECPHCEAAMPEITKLYNLYRPKGLEIYSVCIDTIRQQWIDGISKNDMKWIVVSDLKGLSSEYVKAYNVMHTPTFFILNDEKAILARPLTLQNLKEKLNLYFK